MHKLVLKIKNNKNYKMFVNMLKHIDFVELENNKIEDKQSGSGLKQLFGMWENRDIDLKKIRNLAWRS